MLILRHHSLVPEIAGRRTYFFDIFRRRYEPRGGLRTLNDLKKEELEIREGRHPDQDPTKYTALGNKRVTPLEMLHYTDRVSGKGYSSFANHSYDKRPYIWPPLRVIYRWLYAGTVIFMVFATVDFEGIYNYIKYKIDEKTPEASTLKEPTDESFKGDVRAPPSECDIPTAEEFKKKKKKITFRERRVIEYENRIRAYSTPDKIFRYFATVKIVYDDGSFEIFMTPEDFVRSLTPGVMQPRNLGLDKFKTLTPNQIQKMHYSDANTIFHFVRNQGLISYSDYLFLMTLLSSKVVGNFNRTCLSFSAPPSEFRLAFHVYDLNGDGELDEEEFSKVQDLVLSQSNVGQRHRNHVTGAGSFRKSKSSVITKYFFDPNRKEKLSIEKFLQFQQDLHRDILKIEFERRDPESMPVGIISEVSFAELLLLHSDLPEKRQKRMMKRVKRKYRSRVDRRGISFDEVNNYFAFIYHIDKVDLSLHFYKLAGKPLDRELLQKVARKITDIEISDTLIDVVVTLFDENGDGQLSQSEFVKIMKKRMQRGLERPKDTGLMRLVDSLLECSKKQLLSLTN